MYDNNTKDKKAEVKMYCYEVLTIYVKLYNVNCDTTSGVKLFCSP